LSRDRYVAVLAPGGATLVRRRGRGRAEVVDRADSVDRDGPQWFAAADGLERLLAAHKPGRHRLAVVLSSHFARYLLVPWSEEIGSPDELEAYTRIRFEEVYGAVVAGWALRLSPEAAGRPRLAAAIEQGLLDRLLAIAASAGVRLESVQPYLMTAFNRFGRGLRQADFLFVVAEPGRASLLVARDGQWASVGSTSGADSDEAIDALVAREIELLGVSEDAMPGLFVHAPGRADCAPAPVKGARPQVLAPGGAAAAGMPDPALVMAMAAA
jgi:hypothetical protein